MKEKHAIIGAGVAGCITAIMRKKAGYDVIIFESTTSHSADQHSVCSKTSKVVSENHSGSEYPFDTQSAIDCFNSRMLNEKFFGDFIYAGKDYSRIIPSVEMSLTNENIEKYCFENFNLLKAEYETKIAEKIENRVFGDPASAFKIDHTISNYVLDSDHAYVTPQRGFNPVYVSTLLDWHINKLKIPVIESCDIKNIRRHSNGQYEVFGVNNISGEESKFIFSQICICSGKDSFQLSKIVNADFAFPQIYLAHRNISLVKLNKKLDIQFTCLKLEQEYGGMFSPFNDSVAMIYHPPSAHIGINKMDGNSCEVPREVSDFMLRKSRRFDVAEQTLKSLIKYYPILENAEVITTFNSVAINTFNDPRIRRNMGVFEIAPGCSSIILPKWTMAVTNALKSLELSLIHSGYTNEDVKAKINEIKQFQLEVPEEWREDMNNFYVLAKSHALNLGYPEESIYPMNIENIKSLKNETYDIADSFVSAKM